MEEEDVATDNKGKREKVRSHVRNTLAEINKPSKSSKTKQKEYICNFVYRNRLPEVPSDFKFLRYPFENDRLYRYRETTIEKEHKFQIHPELDLGIKLDVIDQERYKVTGDVLDLDPADAALLVADVKAKRNKSVYKTPQIDLSKYNAVGLKKTEYMSNDLYSSVNKFSTRTQTSDRRIADSSNIFNKTQDDKENVHVTINDDNESAISKIEKSFDDMKIAPVHPTRRNLTAKAVYPLLPSEDMIANDYKLVNFDGNPEPKIDENGYGGSEQRNKKSILRIIHKVENKELNKLENKELVSKEYVSQYYIPPMKIKEGEINTYDFVREYKTKFKSDAKLDNDKPANEFENYVISWKRGSGNTDGTVEASFGNINPLIGTAKNAKNKVSTEEARTNNILVRTRELNDAELEERRVNIAKMDPVSKTVAPIAGNEEEDLTPLGSPLDNGNDNDDNVSNMTPAEIGNDSVDDMTPEGGNTPLAEED